MDFKSYDEFEAAVKKEVEQMVNELKQKEAATKTQVSEKLDIAVRRWTRVMMANKESIDLKRIAGLSADQINLISNRYEIDNQLSAIRGMIGSSDFNYFTKPNEVSAGVGRWQGNNFVNLGEPEPPIRSVGYWDEKSKTWKYFDNGNATNRPKSITDFFN